MNKHTIDAHIISMTPSPTPATAASEHTGATLISGLLKERELVAGAHLRMTTVDLTRRSARL